MASERPSSLGSFSNSERQTSSSSIQLPPLPPSTDSLATGTSIPAPAPSPAPMPPPKDPAPMPMPVTPQRKPVLRQKSPLSNEAYFSSPASSMPGAFPTTPPVSTPNTGIQPAQFTTTAYASTPSPSPDYKGWKRPSSVRNLLSFKALRRSSNNTSPDTSSFRPSSSSAESMPPNRPRLNKKRSGTFWRRSSSLGMTFGKEGEDNGSVAGSTLNGATVLEDEGEGQSPTPTPGSDFPTMKKRKSGTFWRRKSSLGMGAALGENGGTGADQDHNTIGTTSPNANGGHSVMDRGRGEDVIMSGQENERSRSDPEIELLRYETTRSISPPPQLPDFIGGGGGLGGEDLFKDIHIE